MARMGQISNRTDDSLDAHFCGHWEYEGTPVEEKSPANMSSAGNFYSIFFDPDDTAGNGMAPFQPLCGSQTLLPAGNFAMPRR